VLAKVVEMLNDTKVFPGNTETNAGTMARSG
jgi:hypothetical protein